MPQKDFLRTPDHNHREINIMDSGSSEEDIQTYVQAGDQGATSWSHDPEYGSDSEMLPGREESESEDDK